MVRPPRGNAFDLVLLSEIEDMETIAVGRSIRELERLQRIHGRGRWRKRKGVALVRIGSARPFRAEIHWYEAHGIGRREYKIKRVLE